MSCFDQRNFLPRGNVRGCHVVPGFPAVGGRMNQTIIGPAPYAIQVEWRWGDSVNHAATMRLLGRVGFVFSDALRKVVLRSRQIGADLLPVNASVARFPERVSRKKKQMQINWRKDHWLRAHHPEILCWHGHRQNRLRLTGSSI